MENGEPAYLAGKSGIELAAQILAETTGMTEQPGTAGTVCAFRRILDRVGGCVLSVVLRAKVQRDFRGAFLCGTGKNILYPARSGRQQICRDCGCPHPGALCGNKPETYPYGLRLFASRAGEKIRASACAPSSCTNSGKRTSTRQARRVCIRFPKCLAARWRTCWKNRTAGTVPDSSCCFYRVGLWGWSSQSPLGGSVNTGNPSGRRYGTPTDYW